MNPDSMGKEAKLFFKNGEEWEELGNVTDFKAELDDIDIPEPVLKIPTTSISGTFWVEGMTRKTAFYKIIYGRNHWIKRFLKYIFDRL